MHVKPSSVSSVSYFHHVLPHPSNYFRWMNSTSILGTAPQTEPQSTPAHEVQRFRHSAVVLAHFPGILHFPSPKWRLKLLPVPVLTRNFDFSQRFPIRKLICSCWSPSLNWLYSYSAPIIRRLRGVKFLWDEKIVHHKTLGIDLSHHKTPK